MKPCCNQSYDEENAATGSEWRLEPEGEAEVPVIAVVSDAVESTFVDLDGEGLQVKQMEKIPRKWKRPKGVD